MASVKEDEVPPDLSPSNFPLPGPIPRGLQPGRSTSNRLSPSSTYTGGPSPRTTSPSSFNQVTKDQSFQLPSHASTAGSTPATPTLSVGSTQNHLMSMYQQQQQSHVMAKLPRSLSAPHSDSSSINTSYVQKVLSQQLREYQLVKQQLVNQMKSPQTPKHQQILTLRLNQVNASILLVNQHLLMTSQLALQQQQKGASTGSGEGGKGPMGSKDVGTPTSATLSPPEVFGLDDTGSSEINSLGYSMQSVSLSRSESTSSVSQSSARSVSRLQQIISSDSQGSKQTEVFTDMDNRSVFDDEQQLPLSKPIPSPIGHPSSTTASKSEVFDSCSTAPPSSVVQSSSSGSLPTVQSPSSSLTNSGKFGRSVDEIPEFKPGVPWNPNPSIPSNLPFPQSKKLNLRSDSNQRPDSIPLSAGNSSVFSGSDPPSFVDSNSEADYYHDNVYGNLQQLPPHYNRRPGTSPGMSHQPNPRYSSSGNYASSTASGGYNSGPFYNRQQSGQGFPPRPSPVTPSSQMFPSNQFNPGAGRNRQRLYSQQTTSGGGGGGYGDMGQRSNRGYDSGRKWSFDGNPWGVPEKSGNNNC